MNIHRFIRQERHRLGMSEKQFADALRVSRAAVQQWGRQGGTAPNRNNQPRVAELLGISIAELVSGVPSLRTRASVRMEVPLVSEIEAANFRLIDNFTEAGSFEMVRVTVPVGRHTYALRVQGDTMVSERGDSFAEGSVIVVEPELEALSGDYVIAVRRGDRPTFRQLVSDDGTRYLKPLNDHYPPKVLGSAVIVGVVREFTKRFR